MIFFMIRCENYQLIGIKSLDKKRIKLYVKNIDGRDLITITCGILNE